ncbi:MAG: dTDP-4-dehydrorhamnose 3,5-epimerase [Gammaproteobacteria bacterium]|nr:MAG: dTDP-4-dehydrorhamnose 3,5-epimerase [Gammaproteobacteria bacterium]
MKITEASLPGVLILEPRVFSDDRGFFFESYNKKLLKGTGITTEFVQDNHSKSSRNVLRGLHYQIKQPQGKLVRVVSGEVFDVVVDIRRSSSSFGNWAGFNLSAENKRMIWIPPGFAHGFLVLSETAEFLYKTTDYWAPTHERCIHWCDPDIAIGWPLEGNPIVSAKDEAGRNLKNAELYP